METEAERIFFSYNFPQVKQPIRSRADLIAQLSSLSAIRFCPVSASVPGFRVAACLYFPPWGPPTCFATSLGEKWGGFHFSWVPIGNKFGAFQKKPNKVQGEDMKWGKGKWKSREGNRWGWGEWISFPHPDILHWVSPPHSWAFKEFLRSI